MGSLASASMIQRLFSCMCSIDPNIAAPPAASGKTDTISVASATPGVSHEQLVIFLADTLRGTAEERAPLVLAMSQERPVAAVSCDQVTEVRGASSTLKVLLSR